LLFVTAGWLLPKILSDPEYLWNQTHIILDEVHERGLNEDLILAIVRTLLEDVAAGKVDRRLPRFILMSARA
jgi:HrpA-like RNA helicase